MEINSGFSKQSKKTLKIAVILGGGGIPSPATDKLGPNGRSQWKDIGKVRRMLISAGLSTFAETSRPLLEEHVGRVLTAFSESVTLALPFWDRLADTERADWEERARAEKKNPHFVYLRKASTGSSSKPPSKSTSNEKSKRNRDGATTMGAEKIRERDADAQPETPLVDVRPNTPSLNLADALAASHDCAGGNEGDDKAVDAPANYDFFYTPLPAPPPPLPLRHASSAAPGPSVVLSPSPPFNVADGFARRPTPDFYQHHHSYPHHMLASPSWLHLPQFIAYFDPSTGMIAVPPLPPSASPPPTPRRLPAFARLGQQVAGNLGSRQLQGTGMQTQRVAQATQMLSTLSL